MNLCVIICGLPKNLNLVIDNFKHKLISHKLSFYICTNSHIEIIPEDFNIKKILIIKDNFDDKFRNCCNYLNKVKNSLKIIDENYDLYIIVRSDLILLDLNFDQINEDQLYFSNLQMNQFSNFTNERINDNIIITKSLQNLYFIDDFFEYCKKDLNYLDICLYKYLSYKQIKYSKIKISYKLMLYTCKNIIAICGDSGSGKSTLANFLLKFFKNEDNLLLETDRYHKWERGDKNYDKLTHLNPNANNLEKMDEDIYNLKIGNEIYQVDYDHSTGKFTNKERIESRKNIIISGLHTLYSKSLHSITNLKIFLDTDRDLIKSWKINRDVNERGYDINKVLDQLEKRTDDYLKYIKCQKDNADIILRIIKNGECQVIITRIDIITKILTYVVKNRLNYEFNENNLIIYLNQDNKNSNDEEIKNIMYFKICDIILKIIEE